MPDTFTEPPPILKPCDCLTDCGDDSEVHSGNAAPCKQFIARRNHQRLYDAAPQLRKALLDLVDEVQPLGIGRPTYQAALAVLIATDPEGSIPP